jgi:diguanylate cyclase (GGDEF)-like protein
MAASRALSLVIAPEQEGPAITERGRLAWVAVGAVGGAVGEGVWSSAPGSDVESGAPRPVGEVIVAKLLADLAGTTSGVEFVYRALDTLVDRFELRDAVLALDDPTIGRQVFRAGRLPVGGTRLGDPLLSRPGLRVDPDVVGARVADAVTHLCQVALQLDLRRHDASHDALTGLFNRRSFDALLEQSASRSARYGWPFALALMDIDRFKSLNDRRGHGEGDRILRLVGAQLRGSLRGGDTAARVGGDEFAMILSNGGPEVVDRLLRRLRVAVGRDLDAGVGFSAGVALAPDDATDPQSLFRLADARLYDAKARLRSAEAQADA